MWVLGNLYEITAIGYGDFYGMNNLRYFELNNSLKLIESIGFEGYGIADTFTYACLNNPIFETITLIGMNQPLAVNDVSLNNITVLPNPVKEILYIQNPENIRIEKIIISDILGKVLIRKNNSFNQLNLSGLNSGVLFIKIETENGTITKKLIKQ